MIFDRKGRYLTSGCFRRCLRRGRTVSSRRPLGRVKRNNTSKRVPEIRKKKKKVWRLLRSIKALHSSDLEFDPAFWFRNSPAELRHRYHCHAVTLPF